MKYITKFGLNISKFPIRPQTPPPFSPPTSKYKLKPTSGPVSFNVTRPAYCPNYYDHLHNDCEEHRKQKPLYITVLWPILHARLKAVQEQDATCPTMRPVALQRNLACCQLAFIHVWVKSAILCAACFITYSFRSKYLALIRPFKVSLQRGRKNTGFITPFSSSDTAGGILWSVAYRLTCFNSR
jgi:hypothetical protein